MTQATATAGNGIEWSGAGFRARPGKMIGITFLLVLRYLFALFYLFAGLNKLRQGWLWSDKLHHVFTDRLAELDPATLGAAFLQNFGIPMSMPIAWVVTVVEFAVAVSLFLGYRTRAGALLAVWLMVMFAIGGYYDASLIGLWLWAALFVVFPTGHWLGMDRKLHAQNPQSIWFR